MLRASAGLSVEEVVRAGDRSMPAQRALVLGRDRLAARGAAARCRRPARRSGRPIVDVASSPAPSPCSTRTARKNGQRRCISTSNSARPRRRRRRNCSNAVPTPYQPGSISRHWRPPEHPRDGPQVLDPRRRRARGRAAADVQSRDLGDRRDGAEELDEAVGRRTRARGRRRMARADRSSIARRRTGRRDRVAGCDRATRLQRGRDQRLEVSPGRARRWSTWPRRSRPAR